LKTLERTNLFIVPLDDERCWYRYHHLFAEVLRAFLRRDVGKEGLAPLHTRAAEWYEEQEEINAAFKHAVAAQDFERAARLIEENWLRVGHAGNMNTILRRLETIPGEIIQERPMLSMAFAWALWLTGQMDAVEPHLEAVATTWEGQPTADVADPRQVRLRVGTLILRMYLARHRGQLEEMLGFARRALALAPPDDALLRGYGHLGLAHAYHELGDYEESRSACVEGMSLMRTAGNFSSANLTAFYLCRVLTLLGRLAQADQVVRQALQLTNTQELGQTPACGILYVALASVSRERSDLEEAEAHLGQGLTLSRQGGHHDCVRNGALLMARLRLAQGHPGGALEAIEEAEQAISAAEMPLASAELAAWKARVWIAQENLSAAARWAEEAAHRPGQDRGYTRQIEALTRARVLRAQGKLDQALDQLTLCQQMAEETGAWGWAIEIGIIMALVHAALGNQAEALADLGRALARAEPEGYVQVFVDEGRPMAALLTEFLDAQSRGRRADLPNVSQEFVCRLLDALDQTTAGQEPATTSVPSPLIEPLTERELEVLRLMAKGLSNREIADELVVALGTVKTHLHNIYGKLGVRGRTQAAARAQELQLL
jgi:LuxR family maltose regulon positive regulatory protein